MTKAILPPTKMEIRSLQSKEDSRFVFFWQVDTKVVSLNLHSLVNIYSPKKTCTMEKKSSNEVSSKEQVDIPPTTPDNDQTTGEDPEVGANLNDFINNVTWEYFGVPLLMADIPEFDLEQQEDEEERHYNDRNERFSKEIKEIKSVELSNVNLPAAGRIIGRGICHGKCDVSFARINVEFPNTMPTGLEFPIYDGAVFNTGPDSRLEIIYDDGSKSIVGSRTRVQVRKNHHEIEEDNKSFPRKIQDYLKRRWDERGNEKPKVPGAVIGPIGSNPDVYKISVLNSGGKPATSRENPSGIVPQSAVPMERNKLFYEGVLAPSMSAYGHITLKKDEVITFKIYVSQFVKLLDGAQGFVMTVGDEYGGQIFQKQTYTEKVWTDLVDIEEWPFTAPADGKYIVGFKTMNSVPRSALKFRITPM